MFQQKRALANLTCKRYCGHNLFDLKKALLDNNGRHSEKTTSGLDGFFPTDIILLIEEYLFDVLLFANLNPSTRRTLLHELLLTLAQDDNYRTLELTLFCCCTLFVSTTTIQKEAFAEVRVTYTHNNAHEQATSECFEIEEKEALLRHLCKCLYPLHNSKICVKFNFSS